jgi:hypothetical protein
VALTTSLDLVAHHALFLVHTDVPLYRERIVKMGWRPTESSGSFVRKLDTCDDIEAIHARFAANLEELVLQSARIRPVRWDIALSLMLDRLDRSDVTWWLYGSVALVLRGLDVEPSDVDFAVDDSARTGELFRDVLVEPVTRVDHWVAESIGRAFRGALFEWLSGPRDLDVPHEHGPLDAIEEIRWRDWSVPVPPLHMQLAVAEARGQHDRVAAIRTLQGA